MEHRARVLVVEDEPLIAFVVEDILSTIGAEVVGVAETNVRAIEMVRLGGIDAAVLDCTLDDGDCEPVAEALAAANIRFAVVSGHSLDELRERFPGRPIVAKPFDNDALARAVGEMTSAPMVEY